MDCGMYTLGINAAFHDSSACILRDGQLLAAVEEERFTHVKHGKRPIPFSAYELPFHAIDYCLGVAGIDLEEVDGIAYSFNPYKLLNGHAKDDHIALPLRPSINTDQHKGYAEWDPLFLSFIMNAPGQLADGYPHHLQRRFAGAAQHPEKWNFVEHHIAHAASAFLPSPFKESAVMTIDGRGEHATTSYYLGVGNDLAFLSEVCMPHSLGLLYEEVTAYLGFLHSSDEYKVMALASYGKPVYLDDFLMMVQTQPDGSYTIAEHNLAVMLGPPRKRNEPLEQRHFDIAHSLQKALEEVVLELAIWLYRVTGQDNLCLAGGVALNCVLNATLRDEGPFKRIWV